MGILNKVIRTRIRHGKVIRTRIRHGEADWDQKKVFSLLCECSKGELHVCENLIFCEFNGFGQFWSVLIIIGPVFAILDIIEQVSSILE